MKAMCFFRVAIILLLLSLSSCKKETDIYLSIEDLVGTWKTDYFEIRYENPAENRRYFYQLDGEGIRYEIVAFLKSIEKGRSSSYVEEEVSEAIAGVMEDFYSRRDTRTI